MVHFPGFAPPGLCIQPRVAEVRSAGFPHSEISGSKPVCGSPKLFAAVHVLHRLLAPRHPPHALSRFFYGFIRARPRRGSAWPARRSGRFELLVCFALTLCFRLSNAAAAPGGDARGRGPEGERPLWAVHRQVLVGDHVRARLAARGWWAWVESNYRPHPYQGCALAI